MVLGPHSIIMFWVSVLFFVTLVVFMDEAGLPEESHESLKVDMDYSCAVNVGHSLVIVLPG